MDAKGPPIRRGAPPAGLRRLARRERDRAAAARMAEVVRDTRPFESAIATTRRILHLPP